MTRKTTLIREEIKTRIDALAVFTKVYAYTTIINDSNLPAVSVQTLGGVVGSEFYDTIGLNVRLQIYAENTKLEETLDALATHLEEEFQIGETLGGLVSYMNPESFDYSVDESGSMGIMGLNFNVKYEN